MKNSKIYNAWVVFRLLPDDPIRVKQAVECKEVKISCFR